jgi:hypothetical protein
MLKILKNRNFSLKLSERKYEIRKWIVIGINFLYKLMQWEQKNHVHHFFPQFIVCVSK